MKTIKFNKDKTITLNNKKYKGYTVGDLPNAFGFITNDNDSEGIYEWFKYKGLTYVEKKAFWADNI